MHRFIILIVFTLISFFTIKAQISVSGSVSDASTEDVLIGVTVLEFGSNNGTVTDENGQYTISLRSDTASLKFLYIGYTTQTIKLNNLVVLNVALKSEELLDEAIVIGYGEQSKTKITSAVSTIDAKTLKKLPVPTVSNGLEGLASGLFVRQGSGEPGFSGSSFEIRNFGNALVIVDGSPGNIDDLDPNEIENISILKDAAAAAVYGVQGGNGVILITTRKGSIGKPELNYSNQFTQTSFTQYPDFLNSVDYANVLNEGLVNDGKSPFYTSEEIEAFRSGSDPINYPNENWKELMFKKYGFQQRHNLNISGGNQKIKYFASAGFLNQGSNYTEDVLNYNQYNLRTNLNAYVNDYLTLQLNLAGRRRLNEAPGYSAYDIFRELSRALPNNLAYYPCFS